MRFSDYQTSAALTDQTPGESADALIIPLLGMAGEVGSLLSEFKKRLRDGDAHERFQERLDEELGDILWYLANTATKFGRNLDTIAADNLDKAQDRWPGVRTPHYRLFDDDFRPEEQLPRRFEVRFDPEGDGTVRLSIDGTPAGDPLRDNVVEADDYRYHDIVHLAFAAYLGWSPTVRGVLFKELGKRKRRTDETIDETEDGGRAIVIDEAIVALVFAYASDHRFLEGVQRLDYALLKTIKLLTANLEVSIRTTAQWQEAILAAFAAWRTLKVHGGGLVTVDLVERHLEVTTD